MILKLFFCAVLVVVMTAVFLAPRDVTALAFRILALLAAIWAVLTA